LGSVIHTYGFVVICGLPNWDQTCLYLVVSKIKPSLIQNPTCLWLAKRQINRSYNKTLCLVHILIMMVEMPSCTTLLINLVQPLSTIECKACRQKCEELYITCVSTGSMGNHISADLLVHNVQVGLHVRLVVHGWNKLSRSNPYACHI